MQRIHRASVGAKSQDIASTASGSGPWLQTRTPLPAGEVPTSVAMGDFNADGRMDWVVANGWDNNLWLYFGNGDGTSATPVILPLTGSSPLWVATADLRKKGRADIVVAEHDSNRVGVLLSNGDGTFKAENDFTAINPDFVTIADVNGDGYPDIATGGIGCASVLIGDGKGDFQAPRTSCAQKLDLQGYPPPDFTTFISFADFNKDGKLDLLISAPADGVELLSGDGQGHFSSPVRLVFGSTVTNAPYFFFTSTVIDFNGDGCPDAAVGDWIGKVFLFTGDCAGNFKHPASLTLGVGDVPAQLSVADINEDGHPDLISSGIQNHFDFPSSGHMLSIMLGDGQGDFQHAQLYRGGFSLVSFAMGDLNGDGKPDVLAAAQGDDALSEFMNDGMGGFGSPQGRSQFSTHGGNNQEAFPGNVGADYNPLLVDINADGQKDVVYLDFADLEKTYSAAVSLNLGVQGFADPVFTPITTDNTNVVSDAVGNFHGTGQLDLLVATDPTQPGASGGTGNVYLMPNLGNGSFGSPIVVYPRANYATSMFALELNGDGKQDMLIFDAAHSARAQLEVLLGNGDGTFKAPVSYPLPLTGNSATFFTGDFNGDKKIDVLVYLNVNTIPRPANVIELLGNGDGTLQSPRVLFGTPGLPPFNLVDLNHDGQMDMVVQDPYPLVPQIVTYFGQPDGTFAQEKTYNRYQGSNAFGGRPLLGDFNRDGNIDAIVPQYAILPDSSVDSWAQFYTNSPDGTLIPTADILYRGEASPTWMVADMDGSGTSSVVEFDNYTPSFHVLKGGPAPPFQLFLESKAIVGDYLQGKVVLNQVASADTSVDLQCSDPAVDLPNTIAIPAGSASQTFNLRLNSGFNIYKALAITATLGNYSTSTHAFSQLVGSSLSVDAPHLSFGLQPINTTSSPVFVTVTNNTSNPIAPSNIVFDPIAASGHPNLDFAETDNCRIAILPGGNCTFNVTFTPTVENVEEHTELDFQDPISGPTYRFVFSGTGSKNSTGAPTITILPASLSFATQLAGSVSTAQSVTITNRSTLAVPISGISINGSSEFTQTNNCGSQLEAGQSCEVNVAFAPVDGNVARATLNIVDAAVGSPQEVTLSGQGVLLSFGVSPASLTIKGGGAGTYQISISETASYQSSITLKCTNLPAHARCDFSPANVNINGTTPATASLTLNTGSEVAYGSTANRFWPSPAALLALLGIPLLIPPKRLYLIRTFLILLVGVVIALGLGACGGGSASGSNGNSNPPSHNTPAGTYTITLIGTGLGLTLQQNVTLVVQ